MMRNAFVVDSYIKKRFFFTVSASIDLKTFEDKLYFFIFFFEQFLTFIHLHVFVSSPLYLCLQPYLSVMLNKGSLEVLVFTGSHSPRRVVRPLDQGALNDGREHSLRIERLPGRLCACLCLRQSWTTALSDPGMVFFFVPLRSFAVQVDEEAKREAALPNDQPVNLHRLFLGGIPAEVEQTSNRVNVPFQGCIWNLMINAVYVTSSYICLKGYNLGSIQS